MQSDQRAKNLHGFHQPSTNDSIPIRDWRTGSSQLFFSLSRSCSFSGSVLAAAQTPVYVGQQRMQRGESRQALRRDFQVNGGSFEIASLHQAETHRIMRE